MTDCGCFAQTGHQAMRRIVLEIILKKDNFLLWIYIVNICKLYVWIWDYTICIEVSRDENLWEVVSVYMMSPSYHPSCGIVAKELLVLLMLGWAQMKDSQKLTFRDGSFSVSFTATVVRTYSSHVCNRRKYKKNLSSNLKG